METLLVASHRDQYYSRGKTHGSAQFGSSPSRGFRAINCRAFEYGGKLLSTPPRLSYASHSSPKTPAPTACNKSGDGQPVKRRVNSSSPISISLKGSQKESPIPISELWAGPTYSNSPPPSSLPMPKFQMKPKRTVSLEIPPTASEINLRQMAKSAPASPTREVHSSAIRFLDNEDAATKTLRRMLNLEVADD